MTEPLRILLVEDEADFSYLMCRSLESAGHHVTVCFNATDAISVLRQNRFDLVSTGYILCPDMDGLELLLTLNREGIKPPVIMVTGRGDENVAAQAFRAGALDFVVKDIALTFLSELPKRVTDAVNRIRRQQRARLILVADDCPALASLVAFLLSTEPDFEVLTAHSLEDAQKLFAARPIDLILTDPLVRRTGFELLKWAREHYPNALRLFMTADPSLPEQLETATNSGLLLGYLWKPFRQDELERFVRESIYTACVDRRHLADTPWIVEENGQAIDRKAKLTF